MTVKETELVRRSFTQISLVAEAAGSSFYRRLFELDPALRALFKGDLQEQARKLMHVLGLAVGWLDQPEMLVPAIEALGRRHAVYGVKSEHYRTVGQALILTLNDALGDAFTAEVRDAWIAVYELISSAMQKQVGAVLLSDLGPHDQTIAPAAQEVSTNG